MKQLQIILLAFILCSSARLDAQDAYAKLSFDKKDIKIGEQIEAKLEVAFPVTDAYQFPILKDTLSKGVEIVELGKLDTNFTGNNLSTKVLSRKITLTSFDTGVHIIAPILFQGQNGNLQSEVMLISVTDVEVEMPAQSAQGEEPEIEIKDIKEIRDRSFSVWEWIKANVLWIILGIVLIVGVWAYVKYIHPKLKKKAVQIIPEKRTIPPHLVAKEKLKALENQKLWQNGKVKAFHSHLSEIVREYIELRFNLPALESTTLEISASMEKTEVSDDIRQELNTLLQLSDLVKFAKYNAIPSENDNNLKLAHRFIDETKLKEETPNKEVQEEVKNEHV